MFTLGIDPGLNGAIACGDGVNVLDVYSMPIVEREIDGRVKRSIDHVALRDLLAAIVAAYDPELAIVEEVEGWGAQAGQFWFGFTTGCIHQQVAASGVPIETVRPKDWHKALGFKPPKGSTKSQRKKLSRAVADKLFPHHRHLWPRVKDHDRAEAGLLHLYGHHLRKSYHNGAASLPVSSGGCALAC